MGLIDYQSNIIYWDEVHWQWLPYVHASKYIKLPGTNQKKIDFNLDVYKKIVKHKYGYALKNVSEIGCAELSKSTFLNLKTGFIKKVSANDHYGIIKYNGSIYLTISELCNAFRLDPVKVRTQLNKGRSLNEALKRAGTSVKDHLGNQYENQKALAMAYGISQSVLQHRLNSLNWPLEKALTTPTSKKVQDHLGNWYEGQGAMAIHYGIEKATLSNRLNNLNWPLEKALTTPTSEKVQDHLGNWYESQTAMAKHYNQTPETLRFRLLHGWGLEEALTIPVKSNKPVQDHLGNWHQNQTAMAKAYGITSNLLSNRLYEGWSLEDALTTPVENTIVKDHLGNIYQSESAMAKAYGLAQSVLNYRLKKLHWSLGKALTEPKKQDKKVQDHLGNEYKNRSAMARAYGITSTLLSSRLYRGWSLEKALTTPVNKNR